MFKKLLLGLVVAIIVVVGIAAFQPNEFEISRSINIAASPAQVFAQVSDFHRWDQWSPWEKMDPNMKRTFEGPPSGEGAVYAWAGSGQVGEGKMTLVKSQPPELIQIRLDFLKPMKATNLAEFTFTPEDGGALVTWSMSGRKNLLSKVMCLFMNMDKMVGGQFDLGLARLKTVVEATTKR